MQPGNAANGSRNICTLALQDQAASEAFAQGLAMFVKAGDLILMQGDLGAGKTTMARALIRALAGDGELEVPSPTFTLVQPYDCGELTVSHMDFYRLEDEAELDELGLDEALDAGVAIVEWPERARRSTAAWRLAHPAFSEQGQGRAAVLSSDQPDWQERIGRMIVVDRFLAVQAGPSAVRRRIPGDASSRRYERLSAGPASGHGAAHGHAGPARWPACAQRQTL
jgi:tRNA threonylcarbamoyl adenosine modification protein YjeE